MASPSTGSGESDWLADPELAARYETSLKLQQQAECYDEVDVPDWDRGATFIQRQTTAWWQWGGWPVTAMATSFAAILLVLFQVRVQVNDQGLMVNFGDSSEQQMQQVLDRKLKEYAMEQQLILTNYLEDHRAKQQKNTLELVSYLVKSGREERREELSDLVSFINEQRDDDNQFYMNQFKQLQYQVNRQ